MIGLIWVALKVVRLGIAIYTGADSDVSYLAQETAQWSVIAGFWFVLFLAMKLLEYLANRFNSAGVMTKTKSLTGKLARSVISTPKHLRKKNGIRKMSDIEAEERLYEIVRQEIERGEIRSGLWTKAEANSNSTDEAAIRARYIRFRFEQLEAQGQLSQEELIETRQSVPEEKLAEQNRLRIGRRGWRLVGLVIGGFALLGVTIGLGYWSWLEYQNRPQVATGIAGIELGMTKAEVTLLKGAPDSQDGAPEWRDDWSGYFLFMTYEEGRNEYDYRPLEVILVGETTDTLRVQRICTNNHEHRFSGTDYFSSIGVYSSEQKVIEKFGRPSAEKVAEDELSKTIYFPWRNLFFIISEGAVETICVFNR